MEKWNGIEGYPYYEVSNRGRVRSLSRLVKCRGGMRSVVGRVRKTTTTSYGYPQLTLGKDEAGRVQVFLVHRLVLTAFRGPAPGMVCRHLDGDPLNNRLANLVWGTYKENMADKKRHGTTYSPAGETNPGAKLTEKQVLRIRKLHSTGEYTQKAIAVAYGITTASVHLIVRRKNWKHLT